MNEMMQISFRSIAERFGVSNSTAHRAVVKVTNALLKVNSERKIISWPTDNRSAVIEQSFRDSHGFPGVQKFIKFLFFKHTFIIITYWIVKKILMS